MNAFAAHEARERRIAASERTTSLVNVMAIILGFAAIVSLAASLFVTRAMRGIFLGAFCLALLLASGCSSTQLKADEAAAKSDAYGAASTVVGLAYHAQVLIQQNPQVASVVGAMLGTAASDLATRAGVSPEDAAALTADVSTPQALQVNLAKLGAAALHVQSVMAPTPIVPASGTP
jgi:hypothetical protein